MNQEIQQYQSDDARITLDVRVENDTVWLTQAQIGILFGVQKSAISKHLKNIFNSGELCQESVVSILETTANDGKTYDVREVPAVHDRFLLLDDTRLYTFGSSFKDLGKKLFCFSLMESEAVVETVKGMVESYADFAE